MKLTAVYHTKFPGGTRKSRKGKTKPSYSNLQLLKRCHLMFRSRKQFLVSRYFYIRFGNSVSALQKIV